MADLTPRTRSENFLNGEDLEPITRREHFYAGRENELPEGHQEPETREEWFIKKYREAGDVTVESLSITENGTYTAPSGKAYSPVSVNVPLPSNAYLLKSIEHEQVASFSDGTDNFLKSLEVAIEPVQIGSGDPSPTNIRPISGWSAVDVSVVGKNLFKLNSSSTSSDVISSIDTSTGKVGIADTSSIKWVAPYFAYSDVMEGQTYTLSVDSLLKYGRVGGSLSYTTPPQPSNIPDTDIGTNIQGAVNNAFPSRTFTANKTQRIYWYYCTDANNSNHQAFDFYPQLELGTESSTMTPYNGQTYKVEFKDGDNPLTVYGGSLDVVSGVLTVEREYVDLGTLDWSMSSSTVHGFYARPSLNYALGEDVVILCSNYPFAGPRESLYYEENKLTCYLRTNVNMPSEFYILDTAYSDATVFKTAMDGAQLVYELATPQTIQLTPTIIKSLQGDNNFSASTGEIELLKYWAKEVM